MNGLIVVDKPQGITSRQALNMIQRQLPPRTRIGHAGTLDPLATGVLVVCLGSATKLVECLQELAKTYTVSILFGARSTTDDAEGTITLDNVHAPPNLEAIRAAINAQVGAILQRPPNFSAIKVGGKRAYHLARRGKAVQLPARTVRIDAIDLNHYEWPRLELTVRCGKGTYIRSLARDLGDALEVGGLVERLRRESIGPFQASEALQLPCTSQEIITSLKSIETVLTAINPQRA